MYIAGRAAFQSDLQSSFHSEAALARGVAAAEVLFCFNFTACSDFQVYSKKILRAPAWSAGVYAACFSSITDVELN